MLVQNHVRCLKSNNTNKLACHMSTKWNVGVSCVVTFSVKIIKMHYIINLKFVIHNVQIVNEQCTCRGNVSWHIFTPFPPHWCHLLLCPPLLTFPLCQMIPALSTPILMPSILLLQPKWEALHTIKKKVVITWNENPGTTSTSGLHTSKPWLELKSGSLGHTTLKIAHFIQRARYSVAHATELGEKNIMWKRKCMKGRSTASRSRAGALVLSKSRCIPIPTPYWGDIILITPTLSAKII